MLYSPVPKNDVDFARTVFKGLITGKESVDEDIDWTTVRMMGYDVATQYATHTDPEARQVFRKALIKNLSKSSFRQAGNSAIFPAGASTRQQKMPLFWQRITRRRTLYCWLGSLEWAGNVNSPGLSGWKRLSRILRPRRLRNEENG